MSYHPHECSSVDCVVTDVCFPAGYRLSVPHVRSAWWGVRWSAWWSLQRRSFQNETPFAISHRPRSDLCPPAQREAGRALGRCFFLAVDLKWKRILQNDWGIGSALCPSTIADEGIPELSLLLLQLVRPSFLPQVLTQDGVHLPPAQSLCPNLPCSV